MYPFCYQLQKEIPSKIICDPVSGKWTKEHEPTEVKEVTEATTEGEAKEEVTEAFERATTTTTVSDMVV